MPRIYKPKIFKQFPEVSAGLSTRHVTSPAAYSMKNYDKSVPPVILANQLDFAIRLGFDHTKLAYQTQEHQDNITKIDESYQAGHGDALLTNTPGWLVAVSIADCVAVLVYDPKHHAVATIHAGWRGLQTELIGKTIKKMSQLYGTTPNEVYVYVSPTAGQCCYEVSAEVAKQFDAKFSQPKEAKFMLDLKSITLDQLASAGVTPKNVEIDPHCTIHETRYHSFRRDGESTGLMLAAIGLK